MIVNVTSMFFSRYIKNEVENYAYCNENFCIAVYFALFKNFFVSS